MNVLGSYFNNDTHVCVLSVSVRLMDFDTALLNSVFFSDEFWGFFCCSLSCRSHPGDGTVSFLSDQKASSPLFGFAF